MIHAPLLWAAFASPRELAEFAVLDARLRWGLALTCLMIPVLTGAVAWILTRRALGRFDEWVGRPYLAGTAKAAEGARSEPGAAGSLRSVIESGRAGD